MRARRLAIPAALALLSCLGAGSWAAPRGPKAIEVGDQRQKFIYLTDGAGHYIAVNEGATFESAYYSDDGKAFYRLERYGSSADRREHERHLSFFASNIRSRSRRGGDLAIVEGQSWTVTCGDDSVEYKPVSKNLRKRLVKKAAFKEPKWNRRAMFLARDERGNYYFVDRLRGKGAVGWRVFVGRRGKLKRATLVDVVEDSGGVVFNLRSGDVSFNRARVSRDEVQYSAFFHRKGKSEQLTYAAVDGNRELIYRDLGVYPREMGTPCDPFF